MAREDRVRRSGLLDHVDSNGDAAKVIDNQEALRALFEESVFDGRREPEDLNCKSNKERSKIKNVPEPAVNLGEDQIPELRKESDQTRLSEQENRINNNTPNNNRQEKSETEFGAPEMLENNWHQDQVVQSPNYQRGGNTNNDIPEAPVPDCPVRHVNKTPLQQGEIYGLRREYPQYRHEAPYSKPENTDQRQAIPPVFDTQNSYSYRSIAQPEATYKSYKKQIVAIHSPKGGVGKTTITKELAFGFGSARVNNALLKILVVDADWEFGNIATQFDVTPVPNVSEWVRVMRQDRESCGKIPMYAPEEIEARFVVHYNENIDLLVGSANSMDASLIDSEIVSAIMDNLKRCNYDLILIDNANSLKDTTIVPLMKADTIVLVETLDTTTIQDTRNMLETLRSIQFDFSKLRMALNMVPEDDKKLDIGVAEIPRVLKVELAAVIPAYDQVRIYNNSGMPVILDKETSFSKEIKKLANTIMPVFETKPKGFFARLFRCRR